jgi:AcrR family transcriptional regulator
VFEIRTLFNYFVASSNAMGIQERKEQKKEELRGLILDAARKLFFLHGYDETSIRSIAEEIQYSPSAIYFYFKSKDSIFLELHNEGFAKLYARFTEVMDRPKGIERLIAMGEIYIRFAIENPDYYNLMLLSTKPIEAMDDPLNWAEGKVAFQFLLQIVQECQELGRFTQVSTEIAAFTVWATIHGIVSIRMQGRCKVLSEDSLVELEMRSYRFFVQEMFKP